MSSSPPAVPLTDPHTTSEKTSSTTNLSPSTDATQQQSYAENTGGHIFPEAVPNPNSDTKYGLLSSTGDSEKIVHRPASNTYPEVNYSEYHNGSLPQHYEGHDFPPQPYNENAPEAIHRDSSPPYAVDEKKPTKTICGLRRLWFWVILVLIIVVAAIAAIIGGVLGSRAAKSDSSTTFLSNTSLAAVNYTGGDGVTHRRVYFQADSNALYQSAWNSSTQEWLVSPLNPHDTSGPDVKPGTPLAAYTLGDGIHSTVEFHIFFLDTDNKIWERGTKDPDDMWGTQTDNAMNGTLFAGSDSKLAAYGQQCNNFCAQTSIMTYQDYNYSLWWAAYIQNYGWYAQAVNADANHSLVQGSGMALAPVWANESSTVTLYANTGNLTQFSWYQLTAWEKSWSYNRTFAAELDANAEIAAFSQGYVGSNDSTSDMEVVVNEPETSGGINVWDSNFSKTAVLSNSSVAASSFSGLNISSIAASAGGKVYVVEGGEIIEWEWQHGNRSFTRSGTVNTDITT